MRKSAPESVPIGPQVVAAEESRVKQSTLEANGWCGRNGTFVARATSAWRLDTPDFSPASASIDQRNVPVAAPTDVAHEMPEWQKLASLGQKPAAWRGKVLSPGAALVVVPRRPRPYPLPMDPNLVAEGPLPSGWCAAVMLANEKRDPARSVTIADVFEALVASVAAGPVAARGAAHTVAAVLKGNDAAQVEFRGLITQWRKEKKAHDQSEERQLVMQARSSCSPYPPPPHPCPPSPQA